MGIGKTFHVDVSHLEPNGWTFTTQSDHAFYPGKITFSLREGRDGQIQLNIDLKGQTNGISGTAGYFAGGGALEDKTWRHLAKQIEAEICGK